MGCQSRNSWLCPAPRCSGEPGGLQVHTTCSSSSPTNQKSLPKKAKKAQSPLFCALCVRKELQHRSLEQPGPLCLAQPRPGLWSKGWGHLLTHSGDFPLSTAIFPMPEAFPVSQEHGMLLQTPICPASAPRRRSAKQSRENNTHSLFSQV